MGDIVSTIQVEMMVGDVGRNSIPQVFRFFDVALAPAGDVSFSDEDDFSGVDISGTALDTSEGIGVLMDLAACRRYRQIAEVAVIANSEAGAGPRLWSLDSESDFWKQESHEGKLR